MPASIPRVGSFETIEELSPRIQFVSAFKGDATAPANNRMVIVSASQLGIDAAYTPQGTPANPYTLAGPANTGSNPVQLGFKKGDKIRLTAVQGGPGNNLLKEFTLVNPATITVFETVTFPDAGSSYDFEVLRRLG